MAEHQARHHRESKGPIIRDFTMGAILLVWLMYALASVTQLYTSGAKVLDSLPPFWFWGIPIAPYTALYQPWTRPGNQSALPIAPEPPEAVT